MCYLYYYEMNNRFQKYPKKENKVKTRTTLTLDKELTKKTKSWCRKENRSFSGLVDDLLREFLEQKGMISKRKENFTLEDVENLIDEKLKQYFK